MIIAKDKQIKTMKKYNNLNNNYQKKQIGY